MTFIAGRLLLLLLHSGGHCPMSVTSMAVRQTDPGMQQEASPFTVRILPRVAFGAHPLGLDNIDPEDPAVLVLHHYKGTWKLKGWQVLTPGTVVSLATRLYHFMMLKCVLNSAGPCLCCLLLGCSW